jgi:hypothetical protein
LEERTVEICISNKCETAKLSRTCGNVEAVAENYEAESVLWIFRRRFHKGESDADDEFAVLHDPLDHNDIPLRIVDGRPQRLIYVGVPLDANTLQHVTCIPKSSPDACDFANSVLENLRLQ